LTKGKNIRLNSWFSNWAQCKIYILIKPYFSLSEYKCKNSIS